MTYRLASGEQLVAIAVGGGDVFGAGDYVVAFRLPQ
jgi:glucose dehydrogenase